MLKTLVDRAKRICLAELRHLERTLQSNSYSGAEVRRAPRPRKSGGSHESVSQEFVGSAILPDIWGLTTAVVDMRHQDDLKANQEDPSVCLLYTSRCV